MSKKHIHIYDAVAAPFPAVRNILRHHTREVFQLPFEAGLAGVREAHTEIGLDVGSFKLAKEVSLDVTEFTDVPGRIPMGRLQLRWRAADHSALFPVIDADLEAEPIDEEHTMMSLLAMYEPPLGAIGAAADRLVLHPLADSALRGFFHHLRAAIERDHHRLSGEDTDLPILGEIRARAH